MPKIEIYTKSYCPYCKAAKQTLNSMGLSYREIEVSDSQALFNEMLNRSQRKTVPQIFVGDVHIGGYDDLVIAIKNGQFKKTLAR
ncbi:glutaredoxin 3 [Vibrio mimicus]|uniref:glutaredoxin 3 n=1 Tax=Vibrio mimicus TaxID=674 RepID=UPI0002BBF78F|nr:glutaredoxin 3 [Vibrio mimicus]EMB50451.1 glutaredoxin 3 [Vibrio mimicus CAIM 602]MBY7673838.1 glutaredoxin 3 [Vibrio mimicus]MBY7725349.1 glutaredoxin 3 [Vibrio mimicus]TXY31559.1 glutaredoxin 3 [Vibrio mimicus]SUQ22868.1 glutaredoxin 3 [Vibrio mimicus]